MSLGKLLQLDTCMFDEWWCIPDCIRQRVQLSEWGGNKSVSVKQKQITVANKLINMNNYGY